MSGILSVVMLIGSGTLDWLHQNEDLHIELTNMKRLVEESLPTIRKYEQLAKVRTGNDLSPALHNLASDLKEVDIILAEKGCCDSCNKSAMPGWKIKKIRVISERIRSSLQSMRTVALDKFPFMQLEHADCREFWLTFAGDEASSILFDTMHTGSNSLMDGLVKYMKNPDHGGIDLTTERYAASFQNAVFCRLVKVDSFHLDHREQKIPIEVFASLFDEKGLIPTVVWIWNGLITNEPDKYLICHQIRDIPTRSFWLNRIGKCETSLKHMKKELFKNELIEYLKMTKETINLNELDLVLPSLCAIGDDLVLLTQFEAMTSSRGIVLGIHERANKIKLEIAQEQQTRCKSAELAVKGRSPTIALKSLAPVSKSNAVIFRSGIIKISISGCSGCGKTSFNSRLANHDFSDDYKTTIGMDFCTIYRRLNDENCKIQLWDTAGQERFRSISSSYLRGSNAIILYFDLTRVDTLHELRTSFLSLIEESLVSMVPICIIGGKLDLVPSVVQTQIWKDAIALAQEISGSTTDTQTSPLLESFSPNASIHHFDGERTWVTLGCVSPKTNEGVNEIFNEFVIRVIEFYRMKGFSPTLGYETVALKEPQESSSKCC